MTRSPIRDSSLPTLKIGHSIESILIEVIIVAKCASMLADFPFFKGVQLDANELPFQGGIRGEICSWYNRVDLTLSLIIHDVEDSPNHHEGEK